MSQTVQDSRGYFELGEVIEVSVPQKDSEGNGVPPRSPSNSRPPSSGVSSGWPYSTPPVVVPPGRALASAYLSGLLKPEYEEVLNYNFGWNTRAHFDQTLYPGDTVRFRIPAYSAGVVVGLTRATQDFGYADIEFGIHQSRTSGVPVDYSEDDPDRNSANAKVGIIRSGAAYLPTFPEVTVEQGLMIAGLAAGGVYLADLFPLPLPTSPSKQTFIHEFRVFVDRVEYLVITPIGTINVYTYPTPYAMWKLSAALYGGGDKVWDVKIIPASETIDLTLPKVGVFASDVADYSGGNLVLPKISMSGEDYIEANNAEFSLPKILVRGGDDVTWANISLPKITAFSAEETYGIPPIDIAFGYMQLPRVEVQSFASAPEPANVDMALPRVRVFATDVADLTIANIILPGPVNVWSNAVDSLQKVSMVEFAYNFGALVGLEAYYLVWTERIGVVGLMSAATIERALLASKITHASSITANEILRALISNAMSASDVASLVGETLQVWALHLDAGGSTRYEDYNFNSFANIDGVAYGASERGIFRLDGNKDDGADIRQSVDFGRLSFGTNNRKGLPYVYAGMAADGSTVLRVTADGATFNYQVRDSTENMQTHRFELGRGLRASFYDVSLISESSAFDLHNIEFMPIELQRRL